MKKPRIGIRNFLLLCLLLGAVGVPWAWRTYQEARRAAEVERLEAVKAAKITELKKELVEMIDPQSSNYRIEAIDPDPKPVDVAVWRAARTRAFVARMNSIANRLGQLTGVRPRLPNYLVY